MFASATELKAWKNPLSVGILGAAGATGRELVRLLWSHPGAQIAFGTARGDGGKLLDELEPSAPPLPLIHPDEVSLETVDVVFSALPHGASAPVVQAAIDAGARVVDLSGDYRLSDPALHQRIYDVERSPALAERAVYGLPELANRAQPSWAEAWRQADLVANPGCYPTCAGLALAPLAPQLSGDVIVNAVSGVSGAGLKPAPQTHYCSVSNDVRPYKPGRAHRHVWEMEQIFEAAGWNPGAERRSRVVFTPHLVPLERGMLATCVVRVAGLTEAEVRARYEAAYASCSAVRLLPAGREARIRGVVGSNCAHVSLHPVDDLEGGYVVACAIDNLLKGAAGAAVQNFNLMCGLPESLGLPLLPGPQPVGASS